MSDFLDLAKDFCTDNYIWIIGALVVLLLILIGVGIGKRKNKSDGSEGREYFLEGEYDSMLKSAAMNVKKETGDVGISRVDMPKEVTAEREPADIPEIIQAELDALVEASEKEEISIDDEDKQEEGFQPVQININIERGQVKIDYDEDGKIRCTVETDPEEDNFADGICAGDTGDAAETVDAADDADNADATETTDTVDVADTGDVVDIDDNADTVDVADTGDIVDIAGTDGTMAGMTDNAHAADVGDNVDTTETADIVETGDTAETADVVAEAAGVDETTETAEPKATGEAANTYDFIKDKGIILEKIELVKAAPVKKYGRNNFNTSRSGRIYTEEELRKQIKR